MHALKASSFLRPSSRSSSPTPAQALSRPDSGVALDSLPPLSRPSSKGPLNRLTLSSRKRPSQAPSPPPSTLIQDGSYLEALSLKLSEAVSKALAQPTGPPATGETLCNGKRALPNGRGATLGALIASELEASASNSHLHRAILRSLHRPLSVLLTNLSAQLLPLISSPQFTACTSPANPNPTRLHALAYATFAAELLQSLDSPGWGQVEHQGAGVATDSLRSIREGLTSLIGRVVNPLSFGIKRGLVPFIEALEQASPASTPPVTNMKQGSNTAKGSHPSIVMLQNLIPAHARNLARYITPPTMASQTMLATLLISLIWRSLVALAHRTPASPPCTAQPPAPPQLLTPTLRKKRLGSSTTPPNTPPSSRFSIKLPPSRPPSPPATQAPSVAADARALYELLNALPRPSANGQYALAREAVDEAFGSLEALCVLLDFEAASDAADLDVITADLPTVVALPVLLQTFAGRGEGTYPWDVPSLLGMTEQEYRERCLSGFGRAEECGHLVAKRVLDALLDHRDARWDPLVHWLDGRASLAD